MKKMVNRHFLVLGLVVTLGIDMHAQSSAVSTAVLAERNKDYPVAKERIDQAAFHEKTSQSAKTHYHRGSIYDGILKSEKPEIFALAGDSASKIALSSYNKAIELDGEKGEYGKRSKEGITALWSSSINAGAKLFNAGDYLNALTYYQAAMELKPEDTTAYQNALNSVTNILAKGGDQKVYDPLFEQYFSWLDKKDKVDIVGYRNALAMYSQQGRTEKVKALTKVAVVKYPNDKAFLLQEINIMLNENNYEGLSEKVGKVIELDPTNGSLYALRGQLLQTEGNEEEALKTYEEARKLTKNSPDGNYYRDATFNAGGIYFERGRKKWQEAEDLKDKGMDAYLKSGKAVEKDAKGHFEIALPYFEEVKELDKKQGKTDDDTYRILNSIYTILAMEEKQKALLKEME